jgi:murein L,D-transpeptidase YafK
MPVTESVSHVHRRRCARRDVALVALAALIGIGYANAAMARSAPLASAASPVGLSPHAAFPGRMQAKPAAFAIPLKADRILVLKAARKLELLRGGAVLKTYPIALGAHPLGPKRAGGDGRTPEGVYYIDGRQPHSQYHLALHISYPNAADRAQAAAANREPGGDIEIHGLPGWYGGPLDPVRFYKDWTHGCVSVGNAAIEEIYRAVDVGTPIEIRP